MVRHVNRVKDMPKYNKLIDLTHDIDNFILKIKDSCIEKQLSKSQKRNEIFTRNLQSLKIAAELELGNISINKLTKFIYPHSPIFLKEYINHPVSKLIISNIFNILIENYYPNEKCIYLTDKMISASMHQLVSSLDISKFINDLTSNSEINNLLEKSKNDKL